MKKRIAYIDTLRLIAISCVILLHIIALFRAEFFQKNDTYFMFYTVLDVFTRVGVPIFFMITGILLLTDNKEEKYTDFIKRKLPKLVFNYGLFSGVYLIYDMITGVRKNSLFDMIQIVLSRQAYYHLWFMPAMILIYILLPFIKKFVSSLKKEELRNIILVIFTFGNILASVYTLTERLGRPLFANFMFPNLLIYINYLFIGHYLTKYNLENNKKITAFSILSLILAPILTIYVSNKEMVDFFLNSTSPLVVFPSIWLVLQIKKKTKSYKIESFLAAKVIYVYFIHALFLNIFQKKILEIMQKTTIISQLGIILLSFLGISILSIAFAIIYDGILQIIKKYKDAIIKVLISIFNFTFILLFIYILINNLTNRYHFAIFNRIFLLIGIALIVGLFIIFTKTEEKQKRKKGIIIIGIALYLLIQVGIIYAFAVRPSWDFGSIYYLARDVAAGKTKLNEVYYLYICSNNIPIATFFTVLYKPLFMLKIDKLTGIISVLLNLFCVDISIYYLYLIIKKMNHRYAIPFIILAVFFTPLLFYLPIFYTDTLSMPFIVMSIYYFLRNMLEKERKRYIIISAILLGLGTLVKASVLIVAFAIILMMIIAKRFGKISLLSKGLFIGIIIIPILLNHFYVKYYFSQEKMKQQKKPYTHFIMIGLKGDGGFNEEDLQFTTNINGIEEKKQATTKEIKKRMNLLIKEKKLIQFYDKKINYTWADGTFYASRKLAIDPIRPQNQKYIQTEKKPQWYYTLSNAEWILIITLILCGTILRKYLKESHREIQLLLNVSIFGIFLFLIIWETRSRYLVNFIPIFLADAYLGVLAITNFLRRKRSV